MVETLVYVTPDPVKFSVWRIKHPTGLDGGDSSRPVVGDLQCELALFICYAGEAVLVRSDQYAWHRLAQNNDLTQDSGCRVFHGLQHLLGVACLLHLHTNLGDVLIIVFPGFRGGAGKGNAQ